MRRERLRGPHQRLGNYVDRAHSGNSSEATATATSSWLAVLCYQHCGMKKVGGDLSCDIDVAVLLTSAQRHINVVRRPVKDSAGSAWRNYRDAGRCRTHAQTIYVSYAHGPGENRRTACIRGDAKADSRCGPDHVGQTCQHYECRPT